MNGIPDGAIEQHAKLWRPLLERANEPDRYWEWDRLRREKRSGFKHFSLLVDNVYQGLMIVKENDRLRGSEGGNTCCYLSYLAAAPWCRKTVREKINCLRERVMPVGSVLIWQAIRLSLERGSEGRLAWHTLDTALPDYIKAFPDLENLGIDYSEGEMQWLEVGKASSAAFMKRMEPKIEPSYLFESRIEGAL